MVEELKSRIRNKGREGDWRRGREGECMQAWKTEERVKARENKERRQGIGK